MNAITDLLLQCGATVVRADWTAFLSQTSNQLIEELRKRATRDEWQQAHQEPGLDLPPAAFPPRGRRREHPMRHSTRPGCRRSAGTYGMTQIVKETGLARESLYRALDATGNPEFATVMKVMSCLGLNLPADALRTVEPSTSHGRSARL